MTLKELLQVTDLSTKIKVEELNTTMEVGHEYGPDYPDEHIYNLPQEVLNSKVFYVELCTRKGVSIQISVINKEFHI